MFIFMKHLRPTHHSFGPSTGIDRDPADPVDNSLAFGPLERKLVNTAALEQFSGPEFEFLFSAKRPGGPAFTMDRGSPGELEAAVAAHEAARASAEAARVATTEGRARSASSFAERLARGEL